MSHTCLAERNRPPQGLRGPLDVLIFQAAVHRPLPTPAHMQRKSGQAQTRAYKAVPSLCHLTRLSSSDQFHQIPCNEQPGRQLNAKGNCMIRARLSQRASSSNSLTTISRSCMACIAERSCCHRGALSTSSSMTDVSGKGADFSKASRVNFNLSSSLCRL